MLRQLIVNADDFGYTEGVSRGILKAHRDGIVTSTSVMINFPAAAEWIPHAQTEAPHLGLGLHLTLTAGHPAAPPEQIPDLLQDDGRFYNKPDLIDRLPSLNPEQLRAELRAQVAKFERIAGTHPDHLDSHHHITYLSPVLVETMIELAQELDIPIRNPLPDTDDDRAIIKDFFSDVIGGMPSEGFGYELLRILRSYKDNLHVAMPDVFIPTFYGNRAILGELLLILLDVPEGVSELMCHPAELDAQLASSSSYTDKRQTELEALTHPSTREVINSEFIQLITFEDLKPR